MKSLECPQCEGKDIKKGVIRASNALVHMFPLNNLRSKSSSISADYCNDCGYVLSLFVDEPKNLG
ncbi:acetyltransferase [Paenibacillus sp. KN14-4R]|uniref:acetyltransferase n=1 Tax=Paenibacillus sp. KN14-4R TaxID=3445773 RepID=UPI003FA08518